MRIAICAGKTLSGPSEGTVAIKSEAIESRKIISCLKTLIDDKSVMDSSGNIVELIDCTVDSAKSYIGYVADISKKVNASNADIFISIEFYGTENHYCEGSYIYSKGNTVESVMLSKYMELSGYNTNVADGTKMFKLLQSVTCSNAMIFKVCAVDNPKDMERYNVMDIAHNIFLSLIGNIVINGWNITEDFERIYTMPAKETPFDQTRYIGIQEIHGKKYYFDNDGFLKFGFIQLGEMDWMYSNTKTGVLYENAWIMNRMQVYRIEDYKAVLPDPNNTDILPTRVIDGITYTFDKIGCVESEIKRLNGTGKIKFYTGLDGEIYPYVSGIETVVSPYDSNQK